MVGQIEWLKGDVTRLKVELELLEQNVSAQQEGNEAPAEEGAAAAVVRPDHYQQGDEQAMLVSFHMEQCISHYSTVQHSKVQYSTLLYFIYIKKNKTCNKISSGEDFI